MSAADPGNRRATDADEARAEFYDSHEDGPRVERRGHPKPHDPDAILTVDEAVQRARDAIFARCPRGECWACKAMAQHVEVALRV